MRIKKIKIIQLILGIACVLFALFSIIRPNFALNKVLQRMDGFLYDSITYLSLNKHKQDVRIVVIDIDDYSVKIDGRWPWPRDVFANLISNLKKSGVVVIGLDIVLSEAEQNYAESLKQKILKDTTLKPDEKSQDIRFLDKWSPKVDNNNILADTLKNSDVVMGYLFHNEPGIQKGTLPKPIAKFSYDKLNLPVFTGYNGILPIFLEASPYAGFVSNFPDGDGVLRHGQMLGVFQDKVYSSLALSIVMHYLMTDTVTLSRDLTNTSILGTELSVGGIHLPINSRGQILIPYTGFPGTIDTYSASDILHDNIAKDELAGSIAIIGSSMILLSDLHQTPVSQSFSGVEIVGNMISGILSQQIRSEFRWNTLIGMLIISLIALAYALIAPFLGPIALTSVYFISLIALLAIEFWLFTNNNIYLPIAIVIFLLSLQTAINFTYNFILERRQKNKINLLFGQYIPPSHIKNLLETPESISMDGDTRDMTVFFADIRDFTTISENLAAKEIKRLLNTFFSPLTEIIFTHGGTIDKYVGDMIVAFWGAPTVDPEHAYHAIAASIEIRERLASINKKLENLNLPILRIGMGLSSGMMDVGDMGSTFRRSYTVLGDTVNLGSRLQDLTKFYHVPILASVATRLQQDEFIWWPIDKVAVKGRHQATTIYSPFGYLKDATDEMKQQLQEYEAALEAYYKKDWESAVTQFKKLTESYPDLYLYKIFLNRAEEYFQNPPPNDWSGTFVFHGHIY